MPRPAAVILFLAPFVVWDAAVYLMRARGDRSIERRREILRHFTEEDIAVGRDHVLRHNQLYPISRALSYGFVIALLFCGLGARLEARLLPLVGGRWYLALPLFLLVVFGIGTLLSMPLSAYRTFVIEREFELSTITPGLWFLDRLKGLLLSVVFGTLFFLPVLGLIKALPRTWPVPAAGVLILLFAFGLWLHPWLIAPLFNKFTPVADAALVPRIREVAAKAGIPVKEALVMDASKRSRYMNAYFAGLGNSRRIVLYDTLLDECGADEVLSVVAHEAGHWREHHIRKGFALYAAGTIVGLWLLFVVLNSAAVRRFFNVPSPSSLALVVLLPFLQGLGGRLTAPVESAISRHFERGADRAALELTQDPVAAVAVRVRLVRKAKADLLRHRLLHRLYGSHPLPEERIRAAEAYRAAPDG